MFSAVDRCTKVAVAGVGQMISGLKSSDWITKQASKPHLLFMRRVDEDRTAGLASKPFDYIQVCVVLE